MSNKLPNAITDAVSNLVTQQGFFGCLLMEQCQLEYDPSIPTAATDGRRIIVGDWFAKLPLGQRVFVLCHEIMHVALAHIQRSTAYQQRGVGMDLKPFDHVRANRAQDYAVNAILIESHIGQKPDIAPFRAFEDANKTWDNIYLELEGGEGDPAEGSFDEHLPVPDTQAGQSPEQAEEEMKQAVARASQVAKQAGQLPAGLARAVKNLIDPTIPWKEESREFVSACAGKDELSWRKLNKRKLVIPPVMPLPGRDGFALDCAVLAIDTSGSISEEELTMFLSEAKSIFEDLTPRELYIAWWDTACIITPAEDIDQIERAEPYGGGGTDYTCVPSAIEMHDLEPDLVICFTDGWVHWPDQSVIQWPHLTVSTSYQAAPFGRTIHTEG